MPSKQAAGASRRGQRHTPRLPRPPRRLHILRLPERPSHPKPDEGHDNDGAKSRGQEHDIATGLGISGIASALRLHRAGWDVVVLEKAPERRRGGYFIALFGTGIAAAERLGIADAVPNRFAPEGVSYDVDRTGRRRRGLGYADVFGGSRMVMRGDIEDAAFAALPDEVEIRYSTVPIALDQYLDGVDVEIRDLTTETTTVERFDLVVGADGLRSTVRRLAFKPEQSPIRRLNYMIAVYSLPEPVPGYRPQDGLIMAEAGRSVWVFSFADRPPSMLFSYRTDDVDAEFTRPAIDSLRAAYGPEPTGSTLGGCSTSSRRSWTTSSTPPSRCTSTTGTAAESCSSATPRGA